MIVIIVIIIILIYFFCNKNKRLTYGKQTFKYEKKIVARLHRKFLLQDQFQRSVIITVMVFKIEGFRHIIIIIIIIIIINESSWCDRGIPITAYLPLYM